MNNRLQFRHHGIGSGYTVNEGVFNTREEAINYIKNDVRRSDDGLAADDFSNALSLYAEPTVLRYKNNEEEDNPHVILAIGATTNTNDGQLAYNRFCFIDIDKTEKEIADLDKVVDDAVRSLTIMTKNSDSLELFATKASGGTIISGDVRVAESQVIDGFLRDNIIMSTEDGLFTDVDLTYDSTEEKLYFRLNGKTKEWSLSDNFITKGYYSNRDESLHLVRKDDTEVVISFENLIDEWGVEGENSKTPIVLTKDEVKYGDDAHNHVEPWQDILKADVRIADMKRNILEKTSDGRYLYVDGSANNIFYKMSGETEVSVADALDACSDKKLSIDSSNMLYNRMDGFFASATLKYKPKENALVFTVSNVSGGTTSEEIKLNSVELFKDVYYDSTTESLIITYIDGNEKFQKQAIPIGEMLTEWDILNDGHNVRLSRKRNIGGNDKVSADVKILETEDNILQDVSHALYVKGDADNIRYADETVKTALDTLRKDTSSLKDDIVNITTDAAQIRKDLDNEIDRSVAKDAELEAAIEAEVRRSTTADEKHESELERIETKFDSALGEGFNAYDTVKDAIEAEAQQREVADTALSAAVATVSADTLTRLKSVVNQDHSIDVDETDKVNPVIKVNLSEQIEDLKANIIKLNSDGLYAGVDLDYVYNEETSQNQLIFKTTNGTKVFDIKHNSSVRRIYYDPATESVIIEYVVNGQVQDFSVSLKDLIQEWRVTDSTVGAIKLEKTRVTESGPDVLSAEVLISTHPDNILINDEGTLYVSNSSITANAEAIASLQDKDTELEALINAESERAQAKEGELQESISKANADLAAEVTRATSAETEIKTSVAALTTKVDNEITRSTDEDTRLDGLIDALDKRTDTAEGKIATLETNLANEITRSKTVDSQLTSSVTTVSGDVTTMKAEDVRLSGLIENEITRAKGEEAKISSELEAESTRAKNAEAELGNRIENEKAERIAADAELQNAIDEATLSFSDSTTIKITKDDSNNVVGELKIATGNNNIITKDSANEGVFASVSLKYDSATNKLSLVTSAGEQEGVKLGEGSVIESIEYDDENRQLIIKYNDSVGGEHEVSVPVQDLFNEWDVANPSEKSAVELTKVENGTEGGVDTLSARVILSNIEDNMIEFDSNGLYVNGTKFNEATAKTECVESELEAFETAVLGQEITQKCGSGYTYVPNADSTFIRNAASMNHADILLDNAINSAFTEIHASSGDIETLEEDLQKVKDELNVTQDNIIGIVVPDGGKDSGGGLVKYAPNGACHYINDAKNMNDADVQLDTAIYEVSAKTEDIEEALSESDDNVTCLDKELKALETIVGQTVAPCGENAAYRPSNGKVISGATSLTNADELLNNAVTGLQDSLDALFLGSNTPSATLTVNVIDNNKRLEANVRLSHGNRPISDDNMQTDEEMTISDEQSAELTDTNVLSVVDTTKKGYNANISYNGLYLSNKWDCGEYTLNGEGTAYRKYKTDERAEAQNYNYNNYMRQ